jgi:hypothetical protein
MGLELSFVAPKYQFSQVGSVCSSVVLFLDKM